MVKVYSNRQKVRRFLQGITCNPAPLTIGLIFALIALLLLVYRYSICTNELGLDLLKCIVLLGF